MHFGRKSVYFGEGFLDFPPYFRCWCKGRISQPIVAYPASLAGVCNSAAFQGGHRSKSFFNKGLHCWKNGLIQFDAAKIKRQNECGKLRGIHLESFPKLLLGKTHVSMVNSILERLPITTFRLQSKIKHSRKHSCPMPRQIGVSGSLEAYLMAKVHTKSQHWQRACG